MKILSAILMSLLVCDLFSQGFTDVSAANGLAYSYGSMAYGGGVSFVDFDQDGWDDITLTSRSGAMMHFHQNNGNGLTELSPLVSNINETKQALWVDYDNDRDLDLWVSSYQLNRLYRNDGDLLMTEVTYTCGFNDPAYPSFNGAWFDMDDDGFLDLITAHRIAHLTGDLKLYHNLGDGTFEDVTVEAGIGNGLGSSVLAIATLDFDNDGWEDIFVGQDFQVGCLLLRNRGDGTFVDVSISSGANVQNNTMTATVGDYDNNGFMDVFITDTGLDGCSLLENHGNSTFSDVSVPKGTAINAFCWGACFIDADNDMDLDLHVNGMNNTPFSSYMLENDDQGSSFTNVNTAWGFGADNKSSNGNAIGDFNNDGYPEIAKNNAGGTINTFWLNDFYVNHYLTVDLTGTISNSFAVGAVIHLYADGILQSRHVGCGEGFSSQNSYKQFFGLGSNDIADSLMVIWPSNIITRLYNVSADQIVHITEPSSYGCTDPAACNFDATSFLDDGTCIYALTFYDCNQVCLADSDNDGICNELEIAGCTDPMACNFSPTATDQDATCIFPQAFYDCDNHCLNDSDGDGVCDGLEIGGCMDDMACNFSEFATDNNGSCTYASLYFDCDGNCLSDTDEDGVCDELEIAGCDDVLACNFNPDATETDNVLCVFPELNFDCDGMCLNDADGDAICDEFEISGCQDVAACNFDELATDDDGSCVYLEMQEIIGDLTPLEFEEYTYSYVSTTGNLYNWSVENGEFIAGEGTNEVVVHWFDTGAGSLSLTVTNDGCILGPIHLNVQISTAIIEKESEVLRVFPNPAHSELMIQSDVTSALFTVRLMNTMGQDILVMKSTGSRMELNLQSIEAGIYFLKVTGDALDFTKKIIKE